MPLVEVYSDGSSHCKSGLPGGWCFVVVKEGQPVALRYGGELSTSNNRMELEGAIQGLRYVWEKGLHQEALVTLVSDSRYTLGSALGAYSPAKNLDKVTEIRELAVKLRITTRWVAGHNGDRYNEICDRLSRKGKLEVMKK